MCLTKLIKKYINISFNKSLTDSSYIYNANIYEDS